MYPVWRRKKRVTITKGISLTYGSRGVGFGVGRSGSREIIRLGQRRTNGGAFSSIHSPVHWLGLVGHAFVAGVVAFLGSCAALLGTVLLLNLISPRIFEFRLAGVTLQVAFVLLWAWIGVVLYRRSRRVANRLT